jgi:hypothetical protein
MAGAFVKIAICIPCFRQTEAKFTQCLSEMLIYTMSRKIEFKGELVIPQIEVFMVSCSLLTESRNLLVMEALNAEADYMLWMDADHVFPRDALLQLLSHNLPVVGCNYARRHSPTAPTASIVDDEGARLVWTTKGKADEGLIEEVSHLGLGLCLMDMRVFVALDSHCDGNFWPLFRIDPTEDGIKFVGEDVFFFKKIRDAGIPVHCDHGLSWDVGHLHEQILTNAHAEIQKEKWIEHRKKRMDKFKTEDAAA